ncbi:MULTISPECIES: ester cyclase [Xanthobacter]|uniref:ester cyclase n=1 Tax=Xanthobacter TaxID=279 RepID=UPI0035B1D9B5
MTPTELVRSLYEDCLNPRRLDRLPDYVSDTFIGSNGEQGPIGFRQTVERMVAAFPDLRFEIEDLFGVGEKACVRWRFEAAQLGPLSGFPPTGKVAAQQGIAIYEANEGKLTRAWLQVDRLGVLMQIGAVKLG